MKTTLFSLLFVFLISLTLHAQEAPKQKRPGHFGLSFAGIALVQDQWGNVMRYSGGTYDIGTYREKLFYTIGFNYLKPLNAWLDLETGVEYSRKLGEIKSVFLGDAMFEKDNSTMASVPLTLRANFKRFFFVNGGLLADFDLGSYDPEFFGTERYQSGLGYVAGLGAKYGFKYGGQIYINPYFKRRAIVEFAGDEDRLNMNEAGIRVGFYINTKGKTE